jgi:hypothetical protein
MCREKSMPYWCRVLQARPRVDPLVPVLGECLGYPAGSAVRAAELVGLDGRQVAARLGQGVSRPIGHCQHWTQPKDS